MTTNSLNSQLTTSLNDWATITTNNTGGLVYQPISNFTGYSNSIQKDSIISEILNKKPKIFNITKVDKLSDTSIKLSYNHVIPKDNNFIPQESGSIYIQDIDLIGVFKAIDWCYWENSVIISIGPEDSNKVKLLKNQRFITINEFDSKLTNEDCIRYVSDLEGYKRYLHQELESQLSGKDISDKRISHNYLTDLISND